MEAAGGPAAGRGSATACSPSNLRGVRALLDADSLKRSADEAELGAEATPEAESSGSETPGSTRSHVWDELDSLRAAASGNTLNAVGMPWGSLSKRHRSLPMPPRVPSAVMTDDDKDKIVYKSKLSKGDINGVESGANLLCLLLPETVDPKQCVLHLNKPTGRVLSAPIRLITGEALRSKSAEYLGLDAEMWPTDDNTGRYVVFFTIHSSASGAFPYPVDRRLESVELCTCGRSSCQRLPPSALTASCPSEKSYPEQRTCPHRIKSRVLNLIQGRDLKTRRRADRPFTLTIEMLTPGPLTGHEGEVKLGRVTEMQVFTMGGVEPAAFRLSCKTDVAQQACSKRSCEKKKSTLRNAKAELLQVMKELGCDYRGAFVGRPDHTGQIQEYLDIRVSRVYKHLHKKEGVKVNDIAAKFRADFEAGLTYWDTDPVNPYAHAYAKSFAGPASLGTAGRGLESVKLPQNHDEVMPSAIKALSAIRALQSHPSFHRGAAEPVSDSQLQEHLFLQSAGGPGRPGSLAAAGASGGVRTENERAEMLDPVEVIARAAAQTLAPAAQPVHQEQRSVDLVQLQKSRTGSANGVGEMPLPPSVVARQSLLGLETLMQQPQPQPQPSLQQAQPSLQQMQQQQHEQDEQHEQHGQHEQCLL